ncbi:hypothetical protein CPB83DRAFT_845163 [Crepidotus variabilis]|uniref:Uncharacterized protein n=1 Tax=Crepidotus variabilis TaxID=179855 RepID=A0A9P6JUX0_9AGAR|nr:hypothetical protein CPB83DRAFT_845163 [Crepidotus variabilis]
MGAMHQRLIALSLTAVDMNLLRLLRAKRGPHYLVQYLVMLNVLGIETVTRFCIIP